MSRRSSESASEPMPLYPDEGRIALAVLGPKRASAWAAKAAVLERKGLPKIDPLMGGRYWPAVQLFFDHRNGLTSARVVPFVPDGGEETPELEKVAARARARRARRRAIEIVQQDRRSSRS